MEKKHPTYRFDSARLEKESYIHQIIYLSYLFSQGHTYLQADILYWISIQHVINDKSTLPQNVPDYVTNIVAPGQHSKYEGSKNDPQRVSDLQTAWNAFLYPVQVTSESFKTDLLYRILKQMLQIDIEFSDRERPRPSYPKRYSPDSIRDPHASFIRKYIVNQQKTLPVYDTLFEKLNALLKTYKNNISENRFVDNDEIIKLLIVLQKKWEEKHQGHTFFPPSTPQTE